MGGCSGCAVNPEWSHVHELRNGWQKKLNEWDHYGVSGDQIFFTGKG